MQEVYKLRNVPFYKVMIRGEYNNKCLQNIKRGRKKINVEAAY